MDDCRETDPLQSGADPPEDHPDLFLTGAFTRAETEQRDAVSHNRLSRGAPVIEPLPKSRFPTRLFTVLVVVLLVVIGLATWSFLAPRASLDLILVLAILLVLAIGSGIWTYWQHGQKRHYQEAYERESERRALLSRFEHLMKQAGDAILVSDEQARIVEANDRAVAMYGYARDELLGLPVIDTIPAEGRQAWEARREGLRENGSMLGETVHMRKDGTRFPVEVSSRVISAEGGWYSQAIVRDITERRRAEEALRESNERFQLANRATYNAVWDWDLTTDTLWWNDTFQALFGYGPEEIEPRIESWTNRLHPEDVDRVDAGIHLAIDSGQQSWSDHYRFLCKDGTYADVEDRGYISRDSDGAPIRMIGAMRDVTERIRAQEERLQLERQLQHSQKLESLGVLAGGIAHDFNNILTSVLGNAELALSELSPAVPARENLLEISQAARRAADLCRQMLAYSGRGAFVTEPIDLQALIDDIVDLLRSTISKKTILNLNLSRDLPRMRGDASQISQVVMNLVMNASEAIGERSGVITISTGATECLGVRTSWTHTGMKSCPRASTSPWRSPTPAPAWTKPLGSTSSSPSSPPSSPAGAWGCPRSLA